MNCQVLRLCIYYEGSRVLGRGDYSPPAALRVATLGGMWLGVEGAREGVVGKQTSAQKRVVERHPSGRRSQ